MTKVGISALFALLVFSMQAQKAGILRDVHLEISASKQGDFLFKWKISNAGPLTVYVYDFFLWGPAFRVEHESGRIRIATAPVREEPGCAPNRFPPVLLLPLQPGRTIHGDFQDTSIKIGRGDAMMFTIAVGVDPYGAQALVKRFYQSKCEHSPYDAIVRWGTIIDSNILDSGVSANIYPGPFLRMNERTVVLGNGDSEAVRLTPQKGPGG